jgi:hypothetical protein
MIGIIYVLKFSDSKFYIGSTKSKIYDRFYIHKRDLLRGQTSKLYNHWRFVGTIPEIEIIEEVEINSLTELHTLEKEYILSFLQDENCLNTYRPMLTDDERKAYNSFNGLRWRNKKSNQIE